MADQPISVAVVDDHPIFLAGVSSLLATDRRMLQVASCASSTELVATLSQQQVDVLVTDFTMPGGRFGDGLSFISFIRRRFSHTRIVVLTSTNGPQALKSMISAGASGLVSKADPLEYVLAAILAVSGEQSPFLSPSFRSALNHASEEPTVLTKRESEVIRLFVQGLTVAEIAAMIARSVKTVSTQKISAMRKLGLSTDAELIEYATRSGLLPSFSRRPR